MSIAMRETVGRAHAQMARILSAFREIVPPEYHQAILDKVEGRTAPPSGGGRLALVEGGLAVGDDEFDPARGAVARDPAQDRWTCAG
jgi:hypothetical protein